MLKNVETIIWLHSFHTLAKQCSNTFQTGLQQYVQQYVQTGFRKGRRTRDQIGKICWVIKKQGNSKKNFCFIEHTKVFDSVDHNKLWKILKKIGILDHLTRSSSWTRHGTMNLFKIEKGVYQGYILSPCLFNLYAEYIMWNAKLDES